MLYGIKTDISHSPEAPCWVWLRQPRSQEIVAWTTYEDAAVEVANLSRYSLNNNYKVEVIK